VLQAMSTRIRGFFYYRHDHAQRAHAIIQHGTMTLVRRYVCGRRRLVGMVHHRDANFGLRVFEAGYERSYLTHSTAAA